VWSAVTRNVTDTLLEREIPSPIFLYHLNSLQSPILFTIGFQDFTLKPHSIYRENWHNLRIFRNNSPCKVIDLTKETRKLNVFCTVSRQKVFWPLCFDEHTVTGIVYWDMLAEFLLPGLEEDRAASCNEMEYLHFHKEVSDFPNCRFLEK
jgi:hypothetical protein